MSLGTVPDEVVRQTIFNLPFEDGLRVQSVSRRFYQITKDPLLWRYYCLSTFKYWEQADLLTEWLKLPAHAVDWKGAFLQKLAKSRSTRKLLDEIVGSRQDRFKKIEQICQLGYDAKDVLLDQSRADLNSDDILARRYWSNTALGSIHRAAAIEQWYQTMDLVHDPWDPDAQTSLERALVGFDMFLLQYQQGDPEQVTKMLDSLAARFQLTHPGWENMSTRERALALLRWLQTENILREMDPTRTVSGLRKLFLGQNLSQPDVGASSVVASIIFCSVARRLGLMTHWRVESAKIEVFILPPLAEATEEKVDSNHRYRRVATYLDLFSVQTEIQSMVAPTPDSVFSIRAETQQGFVWRESVADMMMHHAGIILDTSRRMNRNLSQHDFQVLLRERYDASENLPSANYASLWACLLFFSVGVGGSDAGFRELLVIHEFYYKEDGWLIRKYLRPLMERHHRDVNAETRMFAKSVLRNIGLQDNGPKHIFRREKEGFPDIPFVIGQIVRHTRYGFLAVIVSWTVDIHSTTEKTPVFFQCVRQNAVSRYSLTVTSIEVVRDPSLVDPDSFPAVGQYFRRFDPTTCSFISNVREEYPDD